MTITIRSQNFKVGERLEDYAKRKLERLYRYLPKIDEIHLDLERQDTKRGEMLTIAQITVRHERGAILRAEEKLRGDNHDTIEAAISMAVDKMYRQIERFKGKRRTYKGKTRFSATLEELEIAEEIPEEEMAVEEGENAYDYDGIEAEFPEPEIVRRKQVAVSAMTEMEAIEQMELLGHAFFMFFNESTSSINVLYKRSNGDYGVLVPDGK